MTLKKLFGEVQVEGLADGGIKVKRYDSKKEEYTLDELLTYDGLKKYGHESIAYIYPADGILVFEFCEKNI